ncbi:sulfotransferase domain-containing protein [uncultured Psychrobacter sp.]|uniref:sulfotransferase domain-containing protein n=1 Tax=uncultured Psychrobacter sp. TaxID=259303 RepID=UPI002599D93E|nr:sulfotransferase domain-containing protein [uncultured Psychrobacter sp.]
MTQPNMMIIGSQKCGTTWLHQVLNQSKYFHGSEPKELNYWNQPNLSSYKSYLRKFEDIDEDVKYVYESTPHYFCLPKNEINIAERIYNKLGDIRLVVLVRNPIDRYLSAYIHNILAGRFPVTLEVDSLTNNYKMIELGHYSYIYKHFQKYFSDIKIYFYDDLVHSETNLISSVFKDFDLKIDLDELILHRKVNDKKDKNKNLFHKQKFKNNVFPTMTDSLKNNLIELYKPSINELEVITGRDLTHWIDK